MYRTRSKGTTLHCKSPPTKLRSLYVVLARASLEAKQVPPTDAQNKPSTSKNATRKHQKTVSVVLQRLDSDSVNNSLAGEADKPSVATKYDKPDARTTRGSRRPGKENSEKVDAPADQAKVTRRGAKARQEEPAALSKTRGVEPKSSEAQGAQTKATKERKPLDKAHVNAKESIPPARASRAVSRAKSVTGDRANEKKASLIVEVNARGRPRRACSSKPPELPKKQPNSKKLVESQPEVPKQNKKIKKTEESRAQPHSEALDTKRTRRATSKAKAAAELPIPRASRAKSVNARLVTSGTAFKAVISKSADSEKQKDNAEASSPFVQPKRYPRRARSTAKEQDLPAKSKKQSKATKHAEVQNRRAEAAKPSSKPSGDIEKTKNKQKPGSAESNELAEAVVQSQATSSGNILNNEVASSSVEAAKLPAARRRQLYIDNTTEIGTGSIKDRPERTSLNDSLNREIPTPALKELRKMFIFPKLAAKANSKEAVDDDPYSFNLSQSEPTGNKSKAVVKAKKRTAKPKPGNNLELLMQKKALDAVGSSCNVQQNPVRYEAERTELQKQLDVSIATAPIFNVDDQPARRSAIPQPSSGTSSAASSRKRSSNFFVLLKDKPTAKVVHSPNPEVPPVTESPEPFVSDSPPIRSKYAVKMAEIAQKQVAKSTPFRVNGNLPSPFYMHLSGNDGTPSFSSDLVEKDQGEGGSSPEESIMTVPAVPEPAAIAEVHQESRSIFEDSNAENIAPESASKKVNRKQPTSQSRSPLKALPISDLAGVSSNATVRKNVVAKKKLEAPIVEPDESMNFDDHTPSEPDQHSRDSFGFDELLEEDKQPQAGTSAGPSTSRSDYREKVENIKQYLPSKNNKSRDKDLFPTSPVKHMKHLHSPMKKTTTNIRQFMTSSTPVLNRPKMSAAFSETFDVTKGTEVDEETLVEGASEVQLFDESQETATVR